MENLGHIEESLFNHLREIEQNLVYIQEKVRNLEISENVNESEKPKISLEPDSRDTLNGNDTVNYVRETYDTPSEISKVDIILETARNEIVKNTKPKKRRTKRNKQTLGFSNYVVDTSSSEDD